MKIEDLIKRANLDTKYASCSLRHIQCARAERCVLVRTTHNTQFYPEAASIPSPISIDVPAEKVLCEHMLFRSIASSEFVGQIYIYVKRNYVNYDSDYEDLSKKASACNYRRS